MSYKKIIGDEITKLLETDKDPITIYENVRDVVYDAVEYHRKMHDRAQKLLFMMSEGHAGLAQLDGREQTCDDENPVVTLTFDECNEQPVVAPEPVVIEEPKPCKSWEVDIELVSDGPDSVTFEHIVALPDDLINDLNLCDELVLYPQEESYQIITDMEKFEPATGMTWTLVIEEVKDQNGKVERIVSLPEPFLKESKWKSGDKLFFNSEDDGSYWVKKATKHELQFFKVEKTMNDEMISKKRELG